ncbi:TetR/AcrR family transcriptional regulator [Amycolatopsis cynarae]|uniref:TetR/AcrR family transcriptional regulator n=1 Tax=Amycolatopsis cynarae TaxID=2995223 RepID=A0ABY7B9J0_9PSEU|nr:TetR/AcrR family transcriptional regulator [Amycolatopsis sp. HUAS 11-8]WAL69025.1 TetR/AcrR family transcriptional regulator [Amycolatopsis sp. HUAS 11-8]
MPRQVDHEARRRQIAEAVWRLAARGGLEDVSLRQVAAEAGVSARLLQYYFGTRDQLLLGALEILNADAERRARERLMYLDGTGDMHAIVRGVLLEMLPLDDERRSRYLVHVAFFVRLLADESLASAVRDGPRALEDLVADLIRQGQELGRARPDIDARAEAVFLLAGAEGLQASMLLGQRTPDEAVALLDHQIDRLFGTSKRSSTLQEQGASPASV